MVESHLLVIKLLREQSYVFGILVPSVLKDVDMMLLSMLSSDDLNKSEGMSKVTDSYVGLLKGVDMKLFSCTELVAIVSSDTLFREYCISPSMALFSVAPTEFSASRLDTTAFRSFTERLPNEVVIRSSEMLKDCELLVEVTVDVDAGLA